MEGSAVVPVEVSNPALATTMSISPDWCNLPVLRHPLGLGDIGSDCDGINAVLPDLGGRWPFLVCRCSADNG
jgi:hypothetical protein